METEIDSVARTVSDLQKRQAAVEQDRCRLYVGEIRWP